jgi:hypothetical protein
MDSVFIGMCVAFAALSIFEKLSWRPFVFVVAMVALITYIK